MSRRGAEAGFALVMAVVAAALFAWLGLFVIEAGGGDTAMTQARLDRARLEAAAEAGLMLAVHGLRMGDRSSPWTIDGSPRQTRFDDAVLTIAVEDERGKVPLLTVDENTVRRLLAAAGIQGRQLDTLAAAIMDWMDADSATRLNGAEADAYRKAGAEAVPRNGKPRTLDELLEVQGMNPDIWARIAPSMTLFFGEPASFNPRTATPLAIMAMLGKSEDSAEVKARRKETAERRPALEIAEDVPLTGRPLTIRVQADIPGVGRAVHTAIIQFTASPARPFWLRSYR